LAQGPRDLGPLCSKLSCERMNKRSLQESDGPIGVPATAAASISAHAKRVRPGTYLQPVAYEATMVHDPTAAPEKQAKVALDEAIAHGDVGRVQVMLQEIGSKFPEHAEVLMMHGLRTAGKEGHRTVMHFLLKQIETCPPCQLLEFLKYAIDGAAKRDEDVGGMMDYLLGVMTEVFKATYPKEFLVLLQHSVNSTARHGNLRLLKFLIDQTSAASLPIDCNLAFTEAANRGQAEVLLKEAIRCGAQYENVLLLMFNWLNHLPANNDSGLGCRHSLKAAARLQILRCYKQSNPEVCARLMSVVREL